MQKSSIYLPEELNSALARAAERQRISKAEYIRQTLADSVKDEMPRFRAVGVLKGPPDLASNIDRYLTESGFGQD
jgi:hypothetical protein